MTDTSTYEIVYIVDNDVADLAHIQQQITELIGGKIKKTEELGNKKFAYPIKKKESGHYFLIQAVVSKTRIVEFQKKIRQMKEILRFLVINLDAEKHFRYPKPTEMPLKTKTSSVSSTTDNKTSEKTPLSESSIEKTKSTATVKKTTATPEVKPLAETKTKSATLTKTKPVDSEK